MPESTTLTDAHIQIDKTLLETKTSVSKLLFLEGDIGVDRLRRLIDAIDVMNDIKAQLDRLSTDAS